MNDTNVLEQDTSDIKVVVLISGMTIIGRMDTSEGSAPGGGINVTDCIAVYKQQGSDGVVGIAMLPFPEYTMDRVVTLSRNAIAVEPCSARPELIDLYIGKLAEIADIEKKRTETKDADLSNIVDLDGNRIPNNHSN